MPQEHKNFRMRELLKLIMREQSITQILILVDIPLGIIVLSKNKIMRIIIPGILLHTLRRVNFQIVEKVVLKEMLLL